MVGSFFIEYKAAKVEEKAIIDNVKAIWKEQGNLVKDLKKLDIYFKTEEGMCYYIINETQCGGFSIESL